jgi:hypothetical protein
MESQENRIGGSYRQWFFPPALAFLGRPLFSFTGVTKNHLFEWFLKTFRSCFPYLISKKSLFFGEKTNNPLTSGQLPLS